jgi:MarR family 2-MHQ and catechol resistance regulon transcriptional repressor
MAQTETGGENGVVSPALKLWVVLARAYLSIEDRAAADAARHDLTLAEFGVLEALYHKGSMLLGEVQRKLLISSGGITYVVDRLEKKGLVERRPCHTDRRARYAALTRKGRALIGRAFPEHEEQMEQILSGLNPGEQRRATELLRKLGRHAAEIEAEVATPA